MKLLQSKVTNSTLHIVQGVLKGLASQSSKVKNSSSIPHGQLVTDDRRYKREIQNGDTTINSTNVTYKTKNK